MVKQTLQRGFTLIELLVVIAIIGILAAVVLTSLSGAQEGAQNSNVQQSMGSIRSAAQLTYNEENFSYDQVCDSDSEANDTLSGLATSLNFIDDTVVVDGDQTSAGSAAAIVCNDADTAYAVSAPLIDGDATDGIGGYWCVDSSGFQGERTTALGSGATTCPGS